MSLGKGFQLLRYEERLLLGYDNRYDEHKEVPMAERQLTRREFLKDISVTCASGSLLISPFSRGIASGKDDLGEGVKTS